MMGARVTETDREWFLRMADSAASVVLDNGSVPLDDVVLAAERFVRAARLCDALEPFAKMGETGFVGSLYENAEENRPVLVHHASVVTVGDFLTAAALYREVS